MDPAPSSSFHIDVRYVVPVATEYRQVFAAAVARWQNVIIGDLSAEYADLPANSCGNSPALDELIDDLLIFVELVPIDGVGQVLGSAGPCYVRSEGLLPVLGTMRFDVADLDRLWFNGSLADVIQHELGHVLGIGTLWPLYSLLQGAGSDDPYFSGALGMSRFTLAGGLIPSGRGVPVENTGSAGTRDSHWRETTLQNELMTGWLISAGNPLSAITIGSLADMGYTVNMFAADPFTLSSAAGLPNLVDRGVEIIEGKPPIVRVLPRD
jgi:hypothetical protein